HNGWLWAMYDLGRGEEALPAVGRPHEILVAHGEWLRAGYLDMSTGYVYRELGQYERALQLYERAETEFGRGGAAGELGLAWAKQHRARILDRRGDFRASMALHAEARDTFVRHEQTMMVLNQEQYIANGYAGQGYYTRALKIYGDVLAAHERAGLDA